MKHTSPALHKHFSKLSDPRMDRTKKHNFMDVIGIVICSVISGAEGWEEMVEFAKCKRSWLERFLVLENGIPSPDTIRRVMSAIRPKIFQECFMNWVQTAFVDAEHRAVALDGKALRGARASINIVSAWAHGENGLCIGQTSTDEKSNEIKAIPDLLEILEIKGALVTIDAAGCQKNIAKKIVTDCEADYLLALKKNQPDLYGSVKDLFENIGPELAIPFETFQTREKAHGRAETRKATIFNDTNWIDENHEWAGIASIGRVESWRKDGEAEKKYEVRYYISSRTMTSEELQEAVRGHWGIENSLHWVLDVSFSEDSCKISDRVAAENLALIRRLSLNMLKKVKTEKDSYKRLRKRCMWDDGFLIKVLLGQGI